MAEPTLEERMYTLAGDKLVKRMYEVFEDESKALSWFYRPIVALGKRSPAEYCAEGNLSEIEQLLGRIEHGIFS